jgi:hypothetical protein
MENTCNISTIKLSNLGTLTCNQLGLSHVKQAHVPSTIAWAHWPTIYSDFVPGLFPPHSVTAWNICPHQCQPPRVQVAPWCRNPQQGPMHTLTARVGGQDYSLLFAPRWVVDVPAAPKWLVLRLRATIILLRCGAQRWAVTPPSPDGVWRLVCNWCDVSLNSGGTDMIAIKAGCACNSNPVPVACVWLWDNRSH